MSSIKNGFNVDPISNLCKREFEKTLTLIGKLKLEATKEIPQRIDYLRTVLNFPNVQRVFHKIHRKVVFTNLRRVFSVWLEYNSQINATRSAIEMKRKQSVIILQCMFRMVISKRKVRMKQQKRELMHETLRNSKVIIIQCFIRISIARRRIAELEIAHRISARKLSTIKIQSRIRGYLARGYIKDRERIALTRDLRDFAFGQTSKLVYRSDLQNFESIVVLELAIEASRIPARPLHSLPHVKVFREYRKHIAQLRKKSEHAHLIVKQQYQKLLMEREKMVLADKESALIEQCERGLRKSIEQDAKEKADRAKREKMDALRRKRRAQTKNLIEQGSEEKFAERAAREDMSREERLTIKYNLAIVQREVKRYGRENELMMLEDSWAHDLRSAELKIVEMKVVLDAEDKKNQQAKLHAEAHQNRFNKSWKPGINVVKSNFESEVNFSLSVRWRSETGFADMRALTRGDRLQRSKELASEDLSNTKPGIGSQEKVKDLSSTSILSLLSSLRPIRRVARLAIVPTERQSGHLNSTSSEPSSSHPSLSYANASPRSSSTYSLSNARADFNLKQHSASDSHVLTSASAFVFIDISIGIDDFSFNKFKALEKLRKSRNLRQKYYISLNIALCRFFLIHRQLVSLRRQLRREKISTRSERKRIQELASKIEKSLLPVKDIIIQSSRRLCEVGIQQVDLFISLFEDFPSNTATQSGQALASHSISVTKASPQKTTVASDNTGTKQVTGSTAYYGTKVPTNTSLNLKTPLAERERTDKAKMKMAEKTKKNVLNSGLTVPIEGASGNAHMLDAKKRKKTKDKQKCEETIPLVDFAYADDKYPLSKPPLPRWQLKYFDDGSTVHEAKTDSNKIKSPPHHRSVLDAPEPLASRSQPRFTKSPSPPKKGNSGRSQSPNHSKGGRLDPRDKSPTFTTRHTEDHPACFQIPGQMYFLAEEAGLLDFINSAVAVRDWCKEVTSWLVWRESCWKADKSRMAKCISCLQRLRWLAVESQTKTVPGRNKNRGETGREAESSVGRGRAGDRASMEKAGPRKMLENLVEHNMVCSISDCDTKEARAVHTSDICDLLELLLSRAQLYITAFDPTSTRYYSGIITAEELDHAFGKHPSSLVARFLAKNGFSRGVDPIHPKGCPGRIPPPPKPKPLVDVPLSPLEKLALKEKKRADRKGRSRPTSREAGSRPGSRQLPLLSGDNSVDGSSSRPSSVGGNAGGSVSRERSVSPLDASTKNNSAVQNTSKPQNQKPSVLSQSQSPTNRRSDSDDPSPGRPGGRQATPVTSNKSGENKNKSPSRSVHSAEYTELVEKKEDKGPDELVADISGWSCGNSLFKDFDVHASLSRAISAEKTELYQLLDIICDHTLAILCLEEPGKKTSRVLRTVSPLHNAIVANVGALDVNDGIKATTNAPDPTQKINEGSTQEPKEGGKLVPKPIGRLVFYPSGNVLAPTKSDLISQYVTVSITPDEWSIKVPLWMYPVYHGGSAAEPETFKQRYMRELRSGETGGTYARLALLEMKVDSCSKNLLRSLKNRVAVSKLKTQIAKEKYEQKKSEIKEIIESQTSKISSIKASLGSLQGKWFKGRDRRKLTNALSACTSELATHQQAYNSLRLSTFFPAQIAHSELLQIGSAIDLEIAAVRTVVGWVTGEVYAYDDIDSHTNESWQCAEIWSFGGMDSIFMLARAVVDRRENPRGIPLITQIQSGRPSSQLVPSHLTDQFGGICTNTSLNRSILNSQYFTLVRGDDGIALRCGFNNREMCSVDNRWFAHVALIMHKKKLFVSREAGKHLLKDKGLCDDSIINIPSSSKELSENIWSVFIKNKCLEISKSSIYYPTIPDNSGCNPGDTDPISVTNENEERELM